MSSRPSAAGQGWRDYYKRVRPLPAEIATRVAEQIEGQDQRVLLLGVTHSYAGLGVDLTAVDWCEEQIAHVWIGDRADRRAVLADWRTMNFPSGHFTAAVGDGSLSCLTWPVEYRQTLTRVATLLAPGGRLVLRIFLAPDEPETVAEIAADVLSGRVGSFYSARWRMAMALAGSGNVAVAAVWEAFERTFPDRAALAVATGWDPFAIDQIDAYRESELVYSFLNRRDLLDMLTGLFENPRFVSSGTYPMAERYPLLVAERCA
jgi:hypothetical protein